MFHLKPSYFIYSKCLMFVFGFVRDRNSWGSRFSLCLYSLYLNVCSSSALILCAPDDAAVYRCLPLLRHMCAPDNETLLLSSFQLFYRAIIPPPSIDFHFISFIHLVLKCDPARVQGSMQRLFSRSQTCYIIHQLSAASDLQNATQPRACNTDKIEQTLIKKGISNAQKHQHHSRTDSAAPHRPVPSPPLPGIICRREEEEEEGGGGVY